MTETYISDRRRADRRRAERLPGSGKVELKFTHPAPAVVNAELIESSAVGFRAAHDSGEIVPGIELEFLRGGSAGRARVIWTHVLGSRRISGFLIL